MKKTIVLITSVTLIIGAVFVFNSKQNKVLNAEVLTIESNQETLDTNSKIEPEIAICYAEAPDYEMYLKAFTYIMDLDSALNTDMKYIALDYKHEMRLEAKENITSILAAYDVKVFESNYEELSSADYSDDNGNLYGILITIDNIEIDDNNITISFTKYRSGLGSISTQLEMTKEENGEWKVIESDAPTLAS